MTDDHDDDQRPTEETMTDEQIAAHLEADRRRKIGAMADSIHAMMVATGLGHGALAGCIGILIARTLAGGVEADQKFAGTVIAVARDVRAEDEARKRRIADKAKQRVDDLKAGKAVPGPTDVKH